MNNKYQNKELIKKIALVGLLTALATVLSFIKIPVVSSSTVTLVLPVIVIGAALCGPWVGAWLTVIPAIINFGDAAMFISWSPFGMVVTLLSKGILTGLAAGFLYKLLCKKHPIGAVTCSAVVAPIVNTGAFLIGCYIFIWDELVQLAMDNSVGIGLLLVGLAIVNFIVELVLNIVLCPAILRIIMIATKKRMTE